nr:MAG TPA: hypothetical protein [Caudoviricetes sp.]
MKGLIKMEFTVVERLTKAGVPVDVVTGGTAAGVSVTGPLSDGGTYYLYIDSDGNWMFSDGRQRSNDNGVDSVIPFMLDRKGD